MSCLLSLDSDDDDGDNPELVIIPPERDEQSDEEDIDDRLTTTSNRNVVLVHVDEVIEDVAGRIEVLEVECEEEQIDEAPTWSKRTPFPRQ